jgi:hypothetical protein
MKRFGILLIIMLIAVSFSVFAVDSVLIDFSTLTADEGDEYKNNSATTVDFSGKAGVGYTDEEKKLMVTSLAIEKWNVVLNSSARSVINQKLSYTVEAPVMAGALEGDIVMGVRVHFPEDPFNAYAMVVPPFEIPAYMQKDENDGAGSKFDGFGVVKNVGAIKSISMNVYGSNFSNGLGIILKDQDGNERNVFMDYLDFKGWRDLGWVNSAYIDEIRNRELKKFPLYPRTTPMRQLVGFIIYKDAAQEGGDVITYIKDVSLKYDLAVLPGVDDIDNEALWGILGKREEARRTSEWSKLGEAQVLRALEEKLLHREEETTE